MYVSLVHDSGALRRRMITAAALIDPDHPIHVNLVVYIWKSLGNRDYLKASTKCLVVVHHILIPSSQIVNHSTMVVNGRQPLVVFGIHVVMTINAPAVLLVKIQSIQQMV